MKIKIKKTGEVREIEDSAFDAELHERIEEGTGSEERVLVGIDELKNVVRTVTEETVNERLKAAGVGEVKRDRVAIGGEAGERKPAFGEAARLRSPQHELYRSLPEWEQKYRSEDTDHWVAEWFRGTVNSDHGRMKRAHDEIGKIYGRDLNTTDDSQLVPTPMAASVIELRRKIQKFGSLQTIQRFVTEGKTLRVPRETGTFAAVQKIAEGAAATPGDPTFTEFTLTKKNSKVYTAASNEILEDKAFNIVQILSRQAARSLALESDLQDVQTGTGTGENQTDAILNNSSVAATTFATPGTLTFLEVNKLYRAIPSEWRSDAVFIGNNTVAGFLDDMLDANGRPIFGDNAAMSPNAVEGGQGGFADGSIKRRPFLEIPITVNRLIIASPSAFAVLESGSVRAEVSRDVRFLNDQIVWKWVMRRDGAVAQVPGFAKTPAITAVA